VRLEVLLTEAQRATDAQMRKAAGPGEFVHGRHGQTQEIGDLVSGQELLVKGYVGVSRGDEALPMVENYNRLSYTSK